MNNSYGLKVGLASVGACVRVCSLSTLVARDVKYSSSPHPLTQRPSHSPKGSILGSCSVTIATPVHRQLVHITFAVPLQHEQ